MSLANLCQLVGGLRQGGWSGEEEEGREEVAELRKGSLQLLEELYSLQHICQGLQSREERVRGTHTHKNTLFFPLFFNMKMCLAADYNFFISNKDVFRGLSLAEC